MAKPASHTQISTRALSAGNQRRNENATHSDRAGKKRAELEWWLFNVTPQRSYRYTYSYLVDHLRHNIKQPPFENFD